MLFGETSHMAREAPLLGGARPPPAGQRPGPWGQCTRRLTVRLEPPVPEKREQGTALLGSGPLNSSFGAASYQHSSALGC